MSEKSKCIWQINQMDYIHENRSMGGTSEALDGDRQEQQLNKAFIPSHWGT